jgi:hypothetical protein
MADFSEYGFVGVLRKPYEADDVINQLESALKGVTNEGTAI